MEEPPEAAKEVHFRSVLDFTVRSDLSYRIPPVYIGESYRAPEDPKLIIELSNDGLEAATEAAAEALMDSVLEEFETRGVADPWQASALVCVLGGYTSYAETRSCPRLRTLANLLASLVLVYGDAETRATLSACGALTLLYAPATVVHQDFPTAFPHAFCPGSHLQTLSCSLDDYSDTIRSEL